MTSGKLFFQLGRCTIQTTRIVTLFCFRSTIRDKIIPRAVSWFTGEAVDIDDIDIEEDDEDNEEEDDDEDDGYEDEEDEDEDKANSQKKVKQISNLMI